MAKKLKQDPKSTKSNTVSQQSYYSNSQPAYKLSVDTSGYSKGKQSFPGVISTGSKKENIKTTFSKEKVDKIIKKPVGSTNLLKKKGGSIKSKKK